MNIRLFDWQVERLKKARCSGAAILRYAFSRYKRGDFGEVVVQKEHVTESKKDIPLLESYSIRQRFGVEDSLLREILRLHWEQPDYKEREKRQKEIDRLDKEISELLTAFSRKE